MASPGNQHCANCIGTLSFPVVHALYKVERWHFSDPCSGHVIASAVKLSEDSTRQKLSTWVHFWWRYR